MAPNSIFDSTVTSSIRVSVFLVYWCFPQTGRRQEKSKLSWENLCFFLLRTIRFIVVSSVINPGCWFLCITSAIFHLQRNPQSNNGLSSVHYSHKPQVIFRAYSGPEAVFLPCLRCPSRLRAGDLSPPQSSANVSPHSSAYLDGKRRVSEASSIFALCQHSFTPTRSLCKAKGRTHLRGPRSGCLGPEVSWPFKKVAHFFLKVETHFKLKITAKREVAPRRVCSPLLRPLTRTYVHAHNCASCSSRWQTWGNHSSPDVWPQFSFQAKNQEQEENYFPISFEFESKQSIWCQWTVLMATHD